MSFANSNSNKTENGNKDTVLKIINIIIPIVCVFLTYLLTNSSAQATIVDELSTYFDFVDESMSYKQALQAVYEESQQKNEKINDLNQQITDIVQDKDVAINDLNQQISTTKKDSDQEIRKLNQKIENLKIQLSKVPDFEFKNSSLISEGLKIQDNINKSVVVIDNSVYYSDNILNLALKNKFSYDSTQNTVFYNENGDKISSETKIDLFKTKILYDGTCYGTYLPSDGKTFSMGSNTYNKGFVIYDDYSLFGEGDGYALFDLQGNYSKIAFDVGRTNEYEKQDVSLKVYLNNEYVEEFKLSAESPPVSLEINLNYANNLKLEITGGSRVKYGFANVVLYY